VSEILCNQLLDGQDRENEQRQTRINSSEQK